MTPETILAYLAAAAAGWLARHLGFLAPVTEPPQSRPARGGAVPPAPVQANLASIIEGVVQEEIKKGIAQLESRLCPKVPPPLPPQS